MNFINIINNTPWKFWNELWRIVFYPLIRINFKLAGIKWRKDWKIYGLPILQIHKDSRIEIGDNLTLRSTKYSNPLSPFHPVVISTRAADSKILIGKNFAMTGGSIVAQKEIEIGDNVMVGANTIIIDTDFHPLDYKKRLENPLSNMSKHVEINDNVFIGTQAVILKGSKIGKNSVIGAAAVVSGIFTENKIIAGNPAKVIGEIND